MIIGYKYDHLDPAEIMFIDGQGELFADPHCVFSLRDVFVRQQKYGAYRRLQAKIIADYFDMTRPALVVERINRTIAQQHSDINQSGTEQEPMDVFRRLIIPRVRAEQVQQATPPIEQDEAIKTPEDVDQTARSIRLHGVVCHRCRHQRVSRLRLSSSRAYSSRWHCAARERNICSRASPGH
ncbi:hypothetical protein KC952_03705 [Candidatus Saccharibacteria bacterium]|nr:hypothetical protein [Candidatus Saccharibacteria bacterium]